MREHLRRGALAGLAGGGASAVVLLALGERTIDKAVALERAANPAASHHDQFSRGVQQAGGATGTVLAGIAMGVVVAIVFAAVRHRLAGPDDWRRATRLAAIGFVTVYLVPWLKYPANPPAVGNPDTIGERTALYLVLLAWSLVATWAAFRVHRWFVARGEAEHRRIPMTAAVYVGLIGLGLVLLPGNPDAITIPAQLLWRFRLASVAGAATFWSVCGITLGWLTLRDHTERRVTAHT